MRPIPVLMYHHVAPRPGDMVTVTPENKIETRKVKPGAKVGSNWIIDEGLKDGDVVVAEGIQRLRDGMTVVPKPVAAATPAAPATPAVPMTAVRRSCRP